MSLSGFQSPGGCVLLTVVLDQRGRGSVIFVSATRRKMASEGEKRKDGRVGWSRWHVVGGVQNFVQGAA